MFSLLFRELNFSIVVYWDDKPKKPSLMYSWDHSGRRLLCILFPSLLCYYQLFFLSFPFYVTCIEYWIALIKIVHPSIKLFIFILLKRGWDTLFTKCNVTKKQAWRGNSPLSNELPIGCTRGVKAKIEQNYDPPPYSPYQL